MTDFEDWSGDPSDKSAIFAINPVGGTIDPDKFSVAGNSLYSHLEKLKGERYLPALNRFKNNPIYTDSALAISIGTFESQRSTALVWGEPASNRNVREAIITGHGGNVELTAGETTDRMFNYIQEISQSVDVTFEFLFEETYPGDSLMQGPLPQEVGDIETKRHLPLRDITNLITELDFDMLLQITISGEEYFDKKRNEKIDTYLKGEEFPITQKFKWWTEKLAEQLVKDQEEIDYSTESERMEIHELSSEKKSRVQKMQRIEEGAGFNLNIRGAARLNSSQESTLNTTLKQINRVINSALPKYVSASVTTNPTLPDCIIIDGTESPLTPNVVHESETWYGIPRVNGRRTYLSGPEEIWNYLLIGGDDELPRDQSTTYNGGDLGPISD